MIEMKTEVYINKIIEDTGLTRIEIKNLVEDKKNELKGLISDEGALFIIAKELGVDIKGETKDILKEIEIFISDITQNMKNITLCGRIKEIYKVNSFERNDGSKGYVGSFLLHDNTGDVRVVLWDNQVNIFTEQNFEKNELIKIVNGSAKKGKYGRIEIHVGSYGKVVLSPEDVDYKKYPKITYKPMDISDINLNLNSLSLEGKIIQLSPISEFTRKDGELGKVQSLTLLDSSGSIRITFWNDNTSKLNNLEINDIILITNLNPRLSTLNSKTIELTANRNTTIEKKLGDLDIEGEIIKNVKKLQDKSGIVSFKGVISSIDNLKSITLKSGEEVSLLGFIVSDNTDGIRVTIWREQAEEYSKLLNVGQGLSLNNVLVKFSTFSRRNEISLINESILELIDLEIKNLKSIELSGKERGRNFSGNYSKIDRINTPGTTEIKGFIAKDLNKITVYEACKKCNKKVDNCICDEVGDTEYRMILNLIIDDGTGTIRSTFMGDLAEKLIGVETNNIVQLRETPEFEKFLEKKSSEFLGKDIIIKGRAKFSDFSNQYEIFVYDFKDIDVDEELERIMKKIET
jgi:replication factor A1